MRNPVRSRIAPTPSGYLHIGNVFSFLLTWAWTRHLKGTLILRIDDIDASRKRPEYVQDIFDTLNWLGISYDEGPQDAQDFEQNYSQHLRLDTYQQALEQLHLTTQTFACDCSRSFIKKHSKNGQYTGFCHNREIVFETPHIAWRIKTQGTQVRWQDVLQSTITRSLDDKIKDFVIRKKDNLPAYQLVSLIDDTQMGITHIVRGLDLLDSTAAQLFLAKQLKISSFSLIHFAHHSLLHTQQGDKLSKSAGAYSIKQMRETGLKPTDIYQRFGKFMNWEGTTDSLATILTQVHKSFSERK